MTTIILGTLHQQKWQKDCSLKQDAKACFVISEKFNLHPAICLQQREIFIIFSRVLKWP